MKIGELARRANINPETVRFYEKAGLLPPPPRTPGNYRDYDYRHVQRVAFIRQARGLGFDLSKIRALLEFANERHLACAEAALIAAEHLQAVEEKIAQLQLLRSELRRDIALCKSGRVRECRIEQALAKLAEYSGA